MSYIFKNPDPDCRLQLNTSISDLQKQLHPGKHVRTFAAAASKPSDSPVESSFRPREELKTSKVEGVTVASVESNQPISRIAIYFKYRFIPSDRIHLYGL